MSYEAFQKRRQEYISRIEAVDSSTLASGGQDEAASAAWNSKLSGKRITTNDLEKARRDYAAASRTGRARIHPPKRIYFYTPSVLPPSFEFDHRMQQNSSFMKLPTELRLQILQEALTPGSYTEHREQKTNNTPSWIRGSAIAIIFTCKQLYLEGRPIALRNYTVMDSELPNYTIIHDKYNAWMYPIHRSRYG
jgi:hypothetical protein